MVKAKGSDFMERKRAYVRNLAIPDSDYSDLSPKGSVDEPIRAFIDEINRIDGLVTTSSCSGRISVFLEGKKKSDASELENQDERPQEATSKPAGPGGKGGGGSWLYVSHDPVQVPEDPSQSHFMRLFGLDGNEGVENLIFGSSTRHIHLKFEPMILHVLTSSYENAQMVLASALTSGFRESGAVALGTNGAGEATPMVAVRSTGLSFDAIIGYQSSTGKNVPMVNETYLRRLVEIANERFKVNMERIDRFRTKLLECYGVISTPATENQWEDAEARRKRKREEGLARQKALHAKQQQQQQQQQQQEGPERKGQSAQSVDQEPVESISTGAMFNE